MSTEQNDSAEQGLSSPATKKIQAVIEKSKRQLAEYLRSQTQRLTTRQQKAVLIGSGLAVGAACLFLMIGPFLGSQKSDLPSIGKMPSALPMPNSPVLSPEDYQMLRGFIRTIDSLKYYDPLTYQEAIKGREGLIDSVRQLITIQP